MLTTTEIGGAALGVGAVVGLPEADGFGLSALPPLGLAAGDAEAVDAGDATGPTGAGVVTVAMTVIGVADGDGACASHTVG